MIAIITIRHKISTEHITQDLAPLNNKQYIYVPARKRANKPVHAVYLCL